jgi:hypothetical protein
MNYIFRTAFMNSSVTAFYIGVTGSFLFYVDELKLGQIKTIFVPIAMLFLLSISVSIFIILIFGQPVLWYLDGRKQDSLRLLATTLAILFAVTVAIFAVPIIALGSQPFIR